MKIIGLLFVLLLSPAMGWAASADVSLDKVSINPRDQASLQRGAKLYVNYCQSCHALKYLRYNQMALDLGIVDVNGNAHSTLLRESLFLMDASIHDTLDIALAPEDASKWFGTVPPDLSLIARVRGEDWLYTYLRSFYYDPSRPFGSNNLLFKDVAMPNVLINLQGVQAPIMAMKTVTRDNETHQVEYVKGLILIEPGELSPMEYDQTITDLVNFLSYAADPTKVQRQNLGFWVLGFLFIMAILTYLLKKEYWRDVDQRKR